MGLFSWLSKRASQAATQPTQTWKVGDRVFARWHDSFLYPGLIRGSSGSEYQIHFDDGDTASVDADNLFAPDVRVGSRVFGRVGGGSAYLPGIVRQQKGETILIEYEHGGEEWTSVSMLRLQRSGGVAIAAESATGADSNALNKSAVDLGESVELGDWRAGDRVLARWLDFYWYPGTIFATGSKGIQILYDDGDQQVVQEAYLMPLLVEEGEQVFVRPKDEPQLIYSPAMVSRVDGEIFDVAFDDGHMETNLRVSRARFWRCPAGIRPLSFDEGDRVLAFDRDGFIYPAEIVSAQDDKVVVQYLDGPQRMLTPELVRRFELSAGTKVECRWKAAPNYFPGKINSIDGERVHIRYDDGDEEWTSIRLIRIPGSV